MANRIETFRRLRDTYISEIGKMYDEERQIEGEIVALEAQLVVARSKLTEKQAERSTNVEQLNGVRAVIRGMEDRATEEARRREDNTIATHRAIEDSEYANDTL